jgi:hypothetical protein
MDVGFYLGELLMQQGEVSVPGLGYFVQVRVSGYYNDAERKFYPPYHKAEFDVQSIDDDSLAEFIANKKNISVASARYFCEKYITNLKQQAAITEVQIGNLGWFYTELSQLTFKPADKIIDDTIFFGFEPISINKINDLKPAEERPKVELNYPPKFTQPASAPAVPMAAGPQALSGALATYETPLPGQPAATEPEALPPFESKTASPASGISPEFFEPVDDEQEESKGPLKLILVVLVVVVFIGLAVFALYRYQPDTFAKIAFWKKETPVVDTIKPKIVVTAVTDTPAVDTTLLDSTRIDTSSNKIDTILSTPSSTQKTGATSQPAVTKQVIKKAPVIAPNNGAEKKTTVVTQPAVITKTTIVSPSKASAAISTVPLKPAAATAKPAAAKVPVSDAVGTRRFEVYVTPACKKMVDAKWVITRLRKKGLDARLVTDAAGPLYHVSIGHFKTAQEAKAFAVKAQESGKVTGDAYPNEIIPQ